MRLKQGDIVLERYRVERFLGAGAMGEVYLGRHVMIGNLVAMKVLLLDANEQVLARFKREARLMAKVRHPNVVSIHDYGELANGLPCIVMEYLEGDELETIIFRDGVFEWKEAIRLLIQILDGLKILHANEIIHRDLKPSNIIYTHTEPRTIKLVDFGTARSLDNQSTKLTAEGMMVGTPAYMAPEILMGDAATEHSDLYAVGLIFYEMVSGTLPFESNNMAQVLKRIRNPLPEPVIPDDKPALPRNLMRYLMQRFLAMEPADRVSSAEGCKRQIERFLMTATAEQPQPLKMSPNKAMIFKPRKKKKPANTSPTPPRRPHTPMEETAPEAPPELFKRRYSDAEKQIMVAQTLPSEPIQTPPPDAPHTDQLPPISEPQQTRARVVLMAKLPPSQLANRDERHWLTELMAQRGRAFVFGGQFWIAIFVGDDDHNTRAQAEEVQAHVVAKYGSHGRTAYRMLDESFKLSAAALSGTSALPDELQALIRVLS